MRSTSVFTLIAAGASLSSATTALAQWGDNPAMHQVVADGAGEQVQPKLVPTPDGGCYISWYTSESGYDVRLQRLDAQGNEMWAHNGVLIADRGFSSTQDYGLDIDSDGNALLAFRDDRFGGVVITAQRVAPDGTLTWGASGVQLGDINASLNSPDIAGTSDGAAVVGWNSNAQSNFARLTSAGAVSWETPIADDVNNETIIISAMETSDNGSVIVSWIQYGFFLGPKHLYAQKIGADGAEVWEDRAAVYNTGSIQFGTFPEFRSDGMGGAVFSWYDTGNSLNVYAQHLNSDGSMRFDPSGASVSLNLRERVAPSAVYDASTDSVYVAWIELANFQNDQGVYAQRLDNLGDRMWGDDGVAVSGIDENASGDINVQVMDNNAVVLWVENNDGLAGGVNDQIKATRLDNAGATVWANDLASDFGQRARFATTTSTDGFVIGVWQIGDFGVADLETHNLNPDGSVGASAACPADLTGDGELNFFDVSAFLSAFNAQDPAADFTGDGEYNFFDVSAFLGAFSAGCP